MCLTTPGRILSVDATDPDLPTAEVDFGIAVRRAALLYTPEAKVGDFVIVHAGFATRRLDPVEVEEALGYWREMKRLGVDAPTGPPGADGA